MSELRARKPAVRSSPSEISVSEKNVDLLANSRTSLPILSATTAFSILLVVRLLSAAYATIPDCDEVFNFWEPAHYLSHGSGLQTWEYSPEYAIRSWAYVALHSAFSRLVSVLPTLTKIHEFYGLRCIFAVVCAYAETRLYTAVSAGVNRRVGLLYLVFTVCAAGMFHAATAFLPSTFAMYTTMLGMAAFIRRRTVWGIWWFAVGGLLGWPFSMAMCVPFLLEDLVLGAWSGRLAGTIGKFTKGGLVSVALLITITTIDSLAYRKLAIVPLNITLYNVFSPPTKGPSIYGTEPWHFYLANLTLNFNLLLPLSLLSLPLTTLHHLLSPPTNPPRILASAAPFYLWLAIFTAQPHKEERFMFVAYPALVLNAAIAYHTALSLWGALSTRLLPNGRAKEVMNWTVLAASIALTAVLGVSRAAAVVTAYSAPMKVYSAVPPEANGSLCVGKEWYRFPSSYFLPGDVRMKWVKSAFDGLLPGEFVEGVGWERRGVWELPGGMNDQNIADPGKYVTIEQCDYLVESYFARDAESESEPDLAVDRRVWEVVHCEDFLDAGRTPMLGRTLWVPKWIPDMRKWGEYCLLKRRAVEEKVAVE